MSTISHTAAARVRETMRWQLHNAEGRIRGVQERFGVAALTGNEPALVPIADELDDLEDERQALAAGVALWSRLAEEAEA